MRRQRGQLAGACAPQWPAVQRQVSRLEALEPDLEGAPAQAAARDRAAHAAAFFINPITPYLS
eukprot:1177121-Prymnesium_polylepis.1